MALVKFLRGLDAKYSYNLSSPTEAHKSALYFATDTGMLYVDGKVYGGNLSDVSVANNVITVSYKDNSTKTFNLLDLISEASEESRGLLSKEDKTFINELASERSAGMAFLSPEQAEIIKSVSDGKYAELEYVDTELGKKVDVSTYNEHLAEYGEYVASNNKALEDLGGEITDVETSLTELINNEVSRATEVETELTNAIDATNDRIDVVLGDDLADEGEVQMSVREIVQDEVALQLTSENISESFDTLKEMAEWLSSHPDTVQEMNDAIEANAAAIAINAAAIAVNKASIEGEAAQREAEIADLKTAVNSYTDAAVAGEAKLRAEADAELAANIALKVDKIEGKGLSTNDFTNEDKARLDSLKVVDVDTTAINGISLKLTADEKVAVGTVNVADLTTALVASELTGLKVKLGKTITDTELTETSTVSDAIDALSVRISNLDNAKVQEITGDSYISVDSTDVTKPALSLSIKAVGTAMVDNTSALKVNSETGALSIEWEDVE